MKQTVLIIEDDPELVHLLDMALKEKYRILYAGHGWAGIELLQERQPEVDLSVIEYDLLTLLVENTGRILTHDMLLSRVWGWDHVGQTNYLKVYIHCLRQKIEQDPGEPRYILTERRLGYRSSPPRPINLRMV